MSGCRQGCCRTPFGVCARQRACRCHVKERTEQAFTDNAINAQHADPDNRPASIVNRRTR